MRDMTASGGERRWTAVMLVDMAGSTAITDEIGAEKAYQMISRLIGYAVAAVERHGGAALTFGGDSLLASFGAPVACEDASLHACCAALEFQAELRAQAADIARRYGSVPRFRIGVSGGTVVVGHMGPSAGMDLNIMGQPVNAASRLQEMAAPGQILITDTIFEQVEGEVDCDNLGPRILKGFADNVRVFSLKGLADNPARFSGRVRRGLVSLVGRSEPRRALTRVLTRGNSGWHVALLKGPPGIGKSRLLHETYSQLRADMRFLTGQCRAGAQTPYRPAAEMLIAASGQRPDADPDSIVQSLGGMLGDIDLGPLRELLQPTPLAGFGGLESSYALALRQSLTAALFRLCQLTPTVLVIEDAHWIDGPSLALIEDLLKLQPESPVALLITSRQQWARNWLSNHSAELIRLAPLSFEETEELARRRFGNVALSPALAKLLFAKSEGNPLFTEEILRYLGSTDALTETGDGLTLREGKGDDLAQGNLQHLVMVRVDALPPALRQTLRYAAVIGRQFSQATLQQISAGRSVAEDLNEAAARGLIRTDPASGTNAWRFTHALLRDAIYGSLLEDSRILMHATVGRALETLHAGRLDEVADALATHFSRADDLKKAAPYLIRAAHKALQVYDLKEVELLLSRVCSMLQDDPDVIGQADYDRMVVDRLETRIVRGDFAGVIELGNRLLPRMRQGNNHTLTEIAIAHLATAFNHARDYDAAIALATRAIAGARARGDVLSVAWLHLPLLRAYEETCAMDIGAFQALAEEILLSVRGLDAPRIEMQIIYLQGANFRSHGLVNKARECGNLLKAFATERNDLRALGFASWSDALMLIVSDEPEQAVALTEKGMSHSVPDTADAHVLLSLWCTAKVLTSAPQAAKAPLDQVLAISGNYGDHNLIEGMSIIQAVFLLRTGKIAEGWGRMCSAIDQIDAHGNLSFSSYFHLMRAEVLLTIAGVMKMPRADSGAPDRKVSPPPRPGLKDLATLVRLRLSARRIARQDIARFRAQFKGVESGAIIARALVCEALLARQKAQQRFLLARARQLAADEGLPNFLRKIDAQSV